jgi:hypothetical protein
VMRISTDLRDAETWDETAIAKRGDLLARLAVSVWARPDDSFEPPAAGSSAEVAPPVTVQPEIPPASTADEAGFASPFAIADGVGVGSELRQIVALAREVGLYPRPDKYSVMISPPGDRRVMLFTVSPQADEGGSFRIWKSPAAFARWLPGVTLEAARAALGSSEESGVLLAHDTEALLEAVRRLVPTGALNQTNGERRASSLTLGIDGAERIPDDVLRVIDLRAAATPELALRFASGALALDGVILRAQQSKGDPWYFQVRHPRFGQVVAYVHPRPSELYIQYRLPADHDTYGAAQGRDNFYGIVLTVREPDGLVVALRLLGDAITRTE